MADVRAIKQAIAASNFEVNPDSKGTISAYTMVQAVGFNGVKVFKRVRIGVEFGVSVDTAKDMMRSIRENNPEKPYDISGRFVMEL